jgi:hypothetical protein
MTYLILSILYSLLHFAIHSKPSIYVVINDRILGLPDKNVKRVVFN